MGGEFFGPYELRLKVAGGRVVVKGHSLPHGVATQEVCKLVLGGQEGAQPGELVRPLALALAKNLRAVLSRQRQVQELKEE